MTEREIFAWNAGIYTMIKIARAAAERIAAGEPRAVAAGAIEALDELAREGASLILVKPYDGSLPALELGQVAP